MGVWQEEFSMAVQLSLAPSVRMASSRAVKNFIDFYGEHGWRPSWPVPADAVMHFLVLTSFRSVFPGTTVYLKNWQQCPLRPRQQFFLIHVWILELGKHYRDVLIMATLGLKAGTSLSLLSCFFLGGWLPCQACVYMTLTLF